MSELDKCEQCGAYLHPRKLSYIESIESFGMIQNQYVVKEAETIKCIKCNREKYYPEERIKIL